MPNKGKNCLHSTPGSDTEQLKLARSFNFGDDTTQQPGKKTVPSKARHSQVKGVAAEDYVKLDKIRARQDETTGEKAQMHT